MRVFIAIEFEQHIKDYLNKIQKQVMSYSTDGNFSRPENFHLTLKFIGEVQPSFLGSINAAMAQSVHGIKPFKLRLHNLGNFPRGNKMIIWMGVGGELDVLNLLFNQLETHQQQIIEVHKISLMESKREEGRLMYIPLHRQPLAD
ncbi:MAG: 2,3-cyclic 3-phosphodiesterase [Clostridiales bacterium]|nr:2,3-cyclic 3-phosphodiesterase [Clostridiales bacterium]